MIPDNQPAVMTDNVESADRNAETDPREMRKVVAASVFGTAMETYDLYLYGTASALVFAPLFFPNQSPAAGTLLALSTFAVSFVARPLGAIVFGHFGDRVGRKSVLFITLLMMGLSTFLVGFLPTYATIGLAAPALLVLLRFLQGFGYGGEYSGAVLMLAEHAPKNRRGFYAGLNNVGPVIGFLASSGLFLGINAAMSDESFMQWGWRVPFLISIILVGIGLYVRIQVSESPVFKHASVKPQPKAAPLPDVFRFYWKELILGTGANIAQFGVFYLVTVFALTYGTDHLGLSRLTILGAVLIAVATNAISVPIASALSDKFGRRYLIGAGLIMTGIWGFPFFALLNSRNFALMVLGFVVMMIAYSTIYGPIASFVSELFGTSVRFTGSALAYNAGGIVGAAFAPIVATILLERFDSSIPISVYIALMSVVSLLCVYLARETKDIDLEDDRAAADRR
ncbi:MAG: MFS transporter [Rhodococcus sp. (in: high G+C Gram-positive bacteria)]